MKQRKSFIGGTFDSWDAVRLSLSNLSRTTYTKQDDSKELGRVSWHGRFVF